MSHDTPSLPEECSAIPSEERSAHEGSAGVRREFLRMATLFQGGLLLLALGLAWLSGIDLRGQLHPTGTAIAWGIGATVPMLLLFAITYRFPIGPLGTIRNFLRETLGPPLAACRWYDLVLVALLAGVSEELLFRGVLQVWSARWLGATAGLIFSNVVFGLAHAVTPTYAVLAGLLGVYLGLLFSVTGETNLIPPILCHGLYDLVALAIFQCEARRTK